MKRLICLLTATLTLTGLTHNHAAAHDATHLDSMPTMTPGELAHTTFGKESLVYSPGGTWRFYASQVIVWKP